MFFEPTLEYRLAVKYMLADTFKCLLVSSVGAVAFGAWQHSWTAGIFSWAFLEGFQTIGWAIEHKDAAQGYMQEKLRKGEETREER